MELNQAVPSFEAKDQNDQIISNQTLLGKKYILFFYGQDDTPTCTKQVCSANDALQDIKVKNYKVYGVSPDTVKKHQKFITKYNLQIDLLSDPDKMMMKDFESFGPKIFMGKEVNGVYRKAFVVNEQGLLVGKIEDVKAAEQGSQILELINSLA